MKTRVVWQLKGATSICFNGLEQMGVHGIHSHVLVRLTRGTLKFLNGLEQMGVHGMHLHVLTQLEQGTLKFFNGLEQRGVHGMKTRVVWQLKEATSICFNGLEQTGVLDEFTCANAAAKGHPDLECQLYFCEHSTHLHTRQPHAPGRPAATRAARASTPTGSGMEYALCLLGAEQARLRRLGRKREREASMVDSNEPNDPTDPIDPNEAAETPTHVSSPVGPHIIYPYQPHQHEDVTEIDLDDSTRNHIYECIVSICEKTQTLASEKSFVARSKSFVARSTLGAFLAAQSVAPQQLGPVWAGLLYVCFETVSDSYNFGTASPCRPEHVRRSVLADMIRFLGTTPQTVNGRDVSMADNELIRGCRRWSRFETNTLMEYVEEAWRLTEIPRVRLAMEGVLSNCAFAKYLFSNPA
jgi:hypothetical protein